MERIEIRFGDLEAVVYIARAYPDALNDATQRAKEIFDYAADVLARHDWQPRLVDEYEDELVDDEEE